MACIEERKRIGDSKYIHDTFDGLAAKIANNVGGSSLRAGKMDYEVIILY